MIIPCIDLMGGKVVQLVQGREKALEGGTPLEMLQKFAAFREIQVIDLDAAMGQGSNDDLVELIASRCTARVGGGVRSPERARKLIEQGAHRVIVGTAAFDRPVLEKIAGRRRTGALDHRARFQRRQSGGERLARGYGVYRGRSDPRKWSRYCSGFLCTYVDKEGLMQGTDLNWFRRLRASTRHELTAAGGITTIEEIRELQKLGIHAALGMAIYTGRLSLDELARLEGIVAPERASRVAGKSACATLLRYSTEPNSLGCSIQ